jgi:hypothetical protein
MINSSIVMKKNANLIDNKKQELLARLKNTGIDFSDNNLKSLENKVKKIEKMFQVGAKNKAGYIDIHYTKDDAKPMLTEINIEQLLLFHSLEIIYDEVKHNIFLYDKNKKEQELSEVSSFIEDEITRDDFQSKNYETLMRKLKAIAFKNRINPVKDYILNSYEKNKDKIDRNNLELDRVFRTIKGRKEDCDINYLLFKTWMLSTVSCQFNTEFKGQGALTFTGSQATGKSTWFSNLVPEPLKKYYKEEFALNTTDKDNYIESVQYWMVELSELGRTIKDSDRAKSHMTKKYDEYRAPYDRTSIKHKRTTVYCATVDKDEFLRDDFNRRWWIIKIIGRFDLIEIDHEMLYAELYSFYLEDKKKCHELNYEGVQKLNDHNTEFNIKDDTDSIILNLFDWESHDRYYLSAYDIGNLIDNPKINNTRIGISLKKMGVKSKIFDQKTKQKYYEIPKPRKIKKIQCELFCEMDYDKVEQERKSPEPSLPDSSERNKISDNNISQSEINVKSGIRTFNVGNANTGEVMTIKASLDETNKNKILGAIFLQDDLTIFIPKFTNNEVHQQALNNLWDHRKKKQIYFEGEKWNHLKSRSIRLKMED